MTLAIFDLDNTLLDGDSDYLWGQHLVKKGLVGNDFVAENKRFLEDYERGDLDIHAFCAFSFRFLSENDDATLAKIHQEFMQEEILPRISAAARVLLQKHRDLGHTLLVITATNRFVVEPIVAELGVPNLLATDPERVNGRYTRKIAGIPCFKEGKVARLKDWLQKTDQDIVGSYFYSDSHNDLPMLELVDNPIVVNADEKLLMTAQAKGWPQMTLRVNTK